MRVVFCVFWLVNAMVVKVSDMRLVERQRPLKSRRSPVEARHLSSLPSPKKGLREHCLMGELFSVICDCSIMISCSMIIID